MLHTTKLHVYRQQSNNYFVSVGIFDVWESLMIYSNLYFKNSYLYFYGVFVFILV